MAINGDIVEKYLLLLFICNDCDLDRPDLRFGGPGLKPNYQKETFIKELTFYDPTSEAS